MSQLRTSSIEIIRRYQSDNGAYVACPNFATYNFCWLRDGTFTAYAMDRVGEHDSARKFYLWVDSVLHRQAERVENIAAAMARGRFPAPGDMLPTRYCLDGSSEEDEWPNFQLDGYGTWLWGLSEHVCMTGDTALLAAVRDSVDLVVKYISLCWKLPNYDCWEEFGDSQHPSTWACLFGGLESINRYLGRREIATVAHSIRNHILTLGVSQGRFVKSVGSDDVDANLLWLAVPFGVVEPQDALMTATVREIERKLYHQGVHRYEQDTYYGGGEWPLLACWLGWYYCQAGKPEAARPILAWVEGCANANGELPEQISEHLNASEYLPEWEQRWGPVATPLLWSHAMYLVLEEEIAGAQSVR